MLLISAAGPRHSYKNFNTVRHYTSKIIISRHKWNVWLAQFLTQLFLSIYWQTNNIGSGLLEIYIYMHTYANPILLMLLFYTFFSSCLTVSLEVTVIYCCTKTSFTPLLVIIQPYSLLQLDSILIVICCKRHNTQTALIIYKYPGI